MFSYVEFRFKSRFKVQLYVFTKNVIMEPTILYAN